MAPLAPGRKAPDFRLNDLADSPRTLGEFLRPGGTLLCLLKTECPTCRLALPFMQNLHAAYAGDRLGTLAVTENTAGEAKAFAAELGLAFPFLCENPPYLTSSAYDLANTPTFFLLGGDGVIERAQVGFLRDFFIEMSAAWAKITGRPLADPFGGAEVPMMSPG